MKLGRCPVCKSHLDLQAMVEDEAGRELLARVSKLPTHLAGPLLAYLGLFRPAKQDLSNSRALALLDATLALSNDAYLLAAAMKDTVAKIQQTRHGRTHYNPLKNHNYLNKVMTGIADRIGQSVDTSNVSTQTTDTQKEDAEANFAAYRRRMESFGGKVLDDGRVVFNKTNDNQNGGDHDD